MATNKPDKMAVFFVIAIAIGALFYFGVFNKDTSGGSDDNTMNIDGYCDLGNDLTLKPKVTRLGKSGTTVVDNFYVLTDKLGTQVISTGVSVSPMKDVEVLFGENSTTYYTKYAKVDIECVDPTYYPVELAYVDTSMSGYINNEDGSVNGASSAQSLAAGGEFDVTLTYKAGADKYFGSPYSECENIGVIQYDKTYINKVEVTDTASVPSFFKYKNATYDGATAFVAPKSADGQSASVSFTIFADSSNDPATNTADPLITVFDCDIDKDEDTLELIEGVEDEDYNLISISTLYNKTVYLS